MSKSGAIRNSNQSSRRRRSYGTSLAIGVLVIFCTRVPSHIAAIYLPVISAQDNLRLLIYVVCNIPICVCSALNPWMFAYHNLELKPVMKRLLKRICHGLHQ